MVGDHQPGQAVFRSILPEEVDWKAFPAGLPRWHSSIKGRP
jgi:hypothetical protein